MKLSSHDLEKISRVTLEHYDRHAEQFWQGTRDHDVSENIAALLQYIEGEPPFTILDFGCGPGRDLKVFSELDHTAIGLEGAAQFVAMARAYSGCEVWQQDFLKLDHLTKPAAKPAGAAGALAELAPIEHHRRHALRRLYRNCAHT